jgi:hypothetical protein
VLASVLASGRTNATDVPQLPRGTNGRISRGISAIDEYLPQPKSVVAA